MTCTLRKKSDVENVVLQTVRNYLHRTDLKLGTNLSDPPPDGAGLGGAAMLGLCGRVWQTVKDHGCEPKSTLIVDCTGSDTIQDIADAVATSLGVAS
ncbi:MAG: hypothetical protein QOD40_43 [Alphaproteobacteria bacterium]|jgi:hypothetical protein|nr:hypothetical protein [Alphaproteobacteria bacterium]